MIIPEPRFYLKDPKSIEPTLISMQAKYNGERVFMSTGEKVRPSDWDSVKQRVVVSRRNPEASQINMWLEKVVSEFKMIFRSKMIDGTTPKAAAMINQLQSALQLNYKPVVEVKPVTFFNFFEAFIEESKVLKGKDTVKAYQTTYNHIKAFSRLTNQRFDFNDITIQWRTRFLDYLQKSGLSRNTEGKHIKVLKVVMNEATERRLNTNLEFRSKSFSKPSEDVPKIFLTEEDLEKLQKLELFHDKEKEIVRDLFLISCYTSLRYSDFKSIQPENIKDGKIEILTKKTGELVIIPIAKAIIHIFEKYEYCLPTAKANQTFNNILKDVGRLADITDKVTIVKTVGGIKTSKTYQKFELMSCHTGRRTMISNSILKGVPTSAIMLISGHRSLKVFQSYVQISKSQNAEALATHQFFS